ncbi:hypothetical protein N5B99_12930 [Acinetobacter johnsonii]|uniref:hypothetical protein n=1 Tax=Acinetobacter johnsonii TaxID=40214 RepID=UPI002447AC97|nr:hypothetical protein [Acinetobacter johnsonii]MDH1241551.1 hypothetical protein [Acinetobacter johnsonii]
MRLINIQIFPKGVNGWGTDLLEFGINITQLFGPNGSGKTPLIQSIAYCLGSPCVFRQDIYDHCNHVKLKIETKKGSLLLSRLYHKNDFEVEVIDSLGSTKIFYSELDYSKYIFEMLDLPSINLVSSSKILTTTYLSTVLPFFFINQDTGYTKIYSPQSNFIKDQYSEMVRFLFKLPVKNSFDLKKDKIIAGENLNLLDKQVEECRRKFEIKNKLIKTKITRSSQDIRNEIEQLENEIENLKNYGSGHTQALNAIDQSISVNLNNISNLDKEISEKKLRISGIRSIISEIQAEVETLSLNESARRVFLSIEEVCFSSSCKLFQASSDSYVKNLLYLKDQIKDLERNRTLDIDYIALLENEREFFKNNICSLNDQKKIAIKKSEVGSIIDAISELKNTIFELSDQLNEIEEVEHLSDSLHRSIVSRDKAYEFFCALNSRENNNIPSIIKFKSDLRKLLVKWLGVLSTKNISYDISFSNDFIPVLGNESIHHLTGSTLTRAVLAYHAAIIELLYDNKIDDFGFLIFDTPKQHEIHNSDLDNYIHELKKISIKYSFQIIFSTTEYHYKGDLNDQEWIPNFDGKEQKMFLFMN